MTGSCLEDVTVDYREMLDAQRIRRAIPTIDRTDDEEPEGGDTNRMIG